MPPWSVGQTSHRPPSTHSAGKGRSPRGTPGLFLNRSYSHTAPSSHSSGRGFGPGTSNLCDTPH